MIEDYLAANREHQAGESRYLFSPQQQLRNSCPHPAGNGVKPEPMGPSSDQLGASMMALKTANPVPSTPSATEGDTEASPAVKSKSRRKQAKRPAIPATTEPLMSLTRAVAMHLLHRSFTINLEDLPPPNEDAQVQQAAAATDRIIALEKEAGVASQEVERWEPWTWEALERPLGSGFYDDPRWDEDEARRAWDAKARNADSRKQKQKSVSAAPSTSTATADSPSLTSDTKEPADEGGKGPLGAMPSTTPQAAATALHASNSQEQSPKRQRVEEPTVSAPEPQAALSAPAPRLPSFLTSWTPPKDDTAYPIVKVGGCTVLAWGRPAGYIGGFQTRQFLLPVGFVSRRVFWAPCLPLRRTTYTCRILPGAKQASTQTKAAADAGLDGTVEPSGSLLEGALFCIVQDDDPGFFVLSDSADRKYKVHG